MKHTHSNQIGKHALSVLFLIILLVLPLSPALRPEQAHAGITTTVVADMSPSSIGSWLESKAQTIGTFLTSGSTGALVTKEYVLDTIAWGLINAVIHEMAQSTITWINSGFQGSPAFVTDLGAFLTGIADKAAGQYIWGSKLGFVCSPFRLDVRMALDIQYKESRNMEIQCSLSGIKDNLGNFVNSANPVNNWDSWYQVSMRPENNVYGTYLLGQQNLGITLSNAQQQQYTKTLWGKGFLSKETCEKVEGIEKCRTVTPGSTIENQLNTALNLPAGRLQVANEFNQVVAALFTQLAKQALGGVGGLLGLTQQGNGGGNGTYFDAMNNDTTTSGLLNNNENPIERSIVIEEDWIDLHEEQIDILEGAQEYLDDSCKAGEPLPNSLQKKITAAYLEIEIGESNLALLTDLALDFADATTAATSSEIMNEYLTLQSSGELHTEMETSRFEIFDLRETQEAVTAFKADVQRACYVNSDIQGAGN